MTQRISDASSRMFAVLAFSLPFAAYGQEAPAQLGREVAIPVHLQDGEEFTTPAQRLIQYGEKLFSAKLFEKLQDEVTTNNAAEELLKVKRSDSGARKYLAAHLPSLIADGPKHRPHVWINEVRLAGAFKLTETLAELRKWIGLPISESAGGSLAERVRLEPFPAGLALVQIGDPAVPTLAGVLDKGDRRERWVAYRALDMIATASATDALRAHVDHEPDPALKAEMLRALGLS